MGALIGVLICAGAPALAQSDRADDLIYDFAATQSCLGDVQADQAVTCFGKAAELCMEQTEYGYSTLGMRMCLNAELVDWDGRLNAAYTLLMAQLKADDAEIAADGGNEPARADALLAMQRAWITFRDTSCEYARAHWGNGTGGGPAYLACALDMTARQAWALELDVASFDAGTCNHKGCTE